MTERISSASRRLALNEENRRWWTLGAMCFALFMIMLDNTVVNVALPSIQRDLDAVEPQGEPAPSSAPPDAGPVPSNGRPETEPARA